MRSSIQVLLAVLATAMALFGSDVRAVRAQPAPGSDLVGALTACSQCGQFMDLLQAAGLIDDLHAPGPLTVWAPTDAALNRLPAPTRQRLRQDRGVLRDVLRYHFAPGTITAAQIVQVPTVRTVEGESVTINAAGGGVRINDAPVVQPDLAASNGIIHVIDGVLIPPSQVQALPRTGDADAGGPVGPAAAGLALVAIGLAIRWASRRRPAAFAP